jgi:hypothetical protein
MVKYSIKIQRQQQFKYRGNIFVEFLVFQVAQIVVDRQAIVKYLVRAMRVYCDKEMLIISYNTGNH